MGNNKKNHHSQKMFTKFALALISVYTANAVSLEAAVCPTTAPCTGSLMISNF